MTQKLLLSASFLLIFITLSCEKKILDIDPLFKFQSLGEGKVLFTHEAKNATSFEWDFGDGSSKSNEENPTYQYQKNGEYTVILIAKNKKSQIVKTGKVTVSDAPKPITKFSYKSLGNGKIEFMNESQNAESYVWSFGEGGNSTAKSPQYQYITNGTYEVKLSAKNTNGVSENKQNITIADAPKPIADFSIIYGENGFVSFTNSSNNATSYQWSFGNGQTSTAQSPSVNYSANGNYSVTLTAKNSNGENTVVKTASVSSIFVPTTGQVVFWSQINKSIKIYVNGTFRGLITKYMTANTPPSCGQEGFVSVTLPQGAYSFTAETDEFFSSKWSGTINVTNGQCRTLQLTKQ
jgi:PKD repeat protein